MNLLEYIKINDDVPKDPELEKIITSYKTRKPEENEGEKPDDEKKKALGKFLRAEKRGNLLLIPFLVYDKIKKNMEPFFNEENKNIIKYDAAFVKLSEFISHEEEVMKDILDSEEYLIIKKHSKSIMHFQNNNLHHNYKTMEEELEWEERYGMKRGTVIKRYSIRDGKLYVRDS